jgi:O-antigen/teichoic acid export membrane protein
MSSPTPAPARLSAPAELGGLLRTYRRQSRKAIFDWGVVLLGLAVSQGSLAVTAIIIARRMPPLEYGQYLSSFGLASLTIVLPNFGLDAWLLTQSGRSTEQLGELWRSLNRARALFLIAWLGAMALLGLALPAETFPWLVLITTSASLALESLALLAFSALRTLGSHLWVVALQIAAAVLLFAVTWFLPLGAGRILLVSLSRAGVWLVMAAVTLAATALLIGTSAAAPAKSEPLRDAGPFMLGEFAASIYLRAPLTIVSLILGAGAASIYGPAVNLILFTFLVPNALYFVIVPILSRALVESPRLFRRLGTLQLAAHTVAGLVISLVTLQFGQVIVARLLGPGYEAAGLTLVLLSPIPLLKSLNFGLGAVLTSGGRQRPRTVTQVICAFFCVAASLVMGLRLGVAGIALVYSFSELLLLGGYALGLTQPARV